MKKISKYLSVLTLCTSIITVQTHAGHGNHHSNQGPNQGGNHHSNQGSNQGGNHHSNQGSNQGGNHHSNQGSNQGGHSNSNQGSGGQPSQAQGQNTSTSTSTSSSSAPSSSGSSTNNYDITVKYIGTHDVGQKLDGGNIVQDPGKPYGEISCGDIAPNELMGGHSPNAKVISMPAKQRTVTIPKGTFSATDGEYYVLDDKGKFIRGSGGKFQTAKGKHMKCNYSFIGHGGFLGDLSADTTEITIGDSIDDTSFKYK